MKLFSGMEYLAIDISNSYGLDKELFETRIQWVRDNIDTLESQWKQASNPILYVKGVKALRAAQKGEAIGHLVEFDATNSGPQIMSALSCCMKGAKSTNLTGDGIRHDCYSTVQSAMVKQLKSIAQIPRQDIKDSVMTSMYGSRLKPLEIFGEGKEIEVFYQTMQTLLPGAWRLKEDLIKLWQPYALEHQWTMPDGFYARVKVMKSRELGIEIDELNHHKFTHTFYKQEGRKKYVSLSGNVIHAIDGMIVREMNRRCNYNPEHVRKAIDIIEDILNCRNINLLDYTIKPKHLAKFLSLSEIEKNTYAYWDDSELVRMWHLLVDVEEQSPFPLICIHDAFLAHPNNMNTVRYWYKEILAELAESNILEDIFSQIGGEKGHYIKLTNPKKMAAMIRSSDYALC